MIKTLKELREDANLSVTQICLELNISEGILEGIESGKHFGNDYKNYVTFLKDKGINVKKLYV